MSSIHSAARVPLPFLAAILIACSTLPSAFATGNNINDWVNPAYVISASIDHSATAASQLALTKLASGTAKKGPWSVMTATSILPPSGDARDYLSWAPYHWPNCNWCPVPGRTHIHTNGSSSNATDYNPAYNASDYPFNYCDDPDDEYCDHLTSSDFSSDSAVAASRLRRIPRHHIGARQDPTADPASGPAPTCLTVTSLLPPVTSDSGDDGSFIPNQKASLGHAQAAAHTTTNKKKPSTTTKKKATPPKKKAVSSSSCTPSPTKALAPSATWTTCPYVTHDGKVNPDVRQLNGVNAITAVTESAMWNSLAYAFKGTPSFSKAAVQMIDAFFLSPPTAIHPNMNYGQVIRGPGKETGQFTGVLDFRGMVKVANAIEILRATESPDWTAPMDAQFVAWTTQYVNWLQTSALGKKTASAANNHVTFYHNQLVAAKLLLKDTAGAAQDLHSYFSAQFQDQLAASGEQPFEAVRTRPFHYRCFNIEAMITLAKLGDQLGLNLWTYQSRYGSTIQKAVDYTMALNPKQEDGSEIFPHVAAVAAAYGDPTGKYSAWLKKKSSTYTSSAWYYYDQPAAFSYSPAATSNTQSVHQRGSGSLGETTIVLDATRIPSNTTSLSNSTGVSAGDASANSTALNGDVASFVCPTVFHTAPETQLDDGLFVTCDDIKPFYIHVADLDASN